MQVINEEAKQGGCNKQKACKERKSKLERRYDTGG